MYSFGEGSAYGDQVVATAIREPLLHHSHVVTIGGDSYRLREKRRSRVFCRRSQGGNTPETTPRTGSVVAHFSVSEVA